MRKFYLLIAAVVCSTLAFGQHVVHKEIVVHPVNEPGAGNTPVLLNESGMIRVKKGDTWSIRPGLVPGSGRSGVLKGAAKAVAAGIATYELAQAAMPAHSPGAKGRNDGGRTVKSLLPALGAGVTFSFKDLTGKKGHSKPFVQCLFYDKQSKLVSVKTLPVDKKGQAALAGRVENSGYMKVMLQDQPGSKLRSDDLVVDIGRTTLNTGLALGGDTFGDEDGWDPGGDDGGDDGGGDDGGGGGWDDGSAAGALLDYIEQNGADGMDGMSFTFNDDGTVTVTDPDGNTETWTEDDFIDELSDSELDDYDDMLDDYTGDDNDDPVTACIGDKCYTISNDQVLIDVPPQNGNTCLPTDMAWVMSMMGLDNVSPSLFMSYYNANYYPDNNIPAQGWFGTTLDFENFMNDFFCTNSDFVFGKDALEAAIDNGNMVICGVDGATMGHVIVIDGYSTEDGTLDPMFSYHDPATGTTGTVDYTTLLLAERPGYSAEITGINTTTPPAHH